MRRRGLRPLAGLLALVVAWSLIAPTQLGGRVSYVNIRGVSMEPTLYSGDLMMVRARDRYEVGQVVAFVSDMNGAIVVHRIVDVVDDRYLLKGDNNTFIDRYAPTAEEILGAEVLTVPGGERVATLAARTPTIVLQIAMLVVTLWAMRVSQLAAQRQRRAARRSRAVRATQPRASDAQDLSAVVDIGSSE